MQQSLEEHRSIVEAIQSRDIALARQTAQEHIENAESWMIESLKNEGFVLAD
jgi:DNA-binding FadR family transcriptional regulator